MRHPFCSSRSGGWRFASGTVWFGKLKESNAPLWFRRPCPDGSNPSPLGNRRHYHGATWRNAHRHCLPIRRERGHFDAAQQHEQCQLLGSGQPASSSRAKGERRQRTTSGEKGRNPQQNRNPIQGEQPRSDGRQWPPQRQPRGSGPNPEITQQRCSAKTWLQTRCRNPYPWSH